MNKLKPVLRWLLAAATLLLAALLAYQCASVYSAGAVPENLSAQGAHINAIYSRELAAQKLHEIRWAFWLWLGCAAAVLLWSRTDEKTAARRKKHRNGNERIVPVCAVSPRVAKYLRPALFLLAAALIAAGVFNGGAQDVLIKAVNICTECIGLG